ncbi:MAG: hypothetical protein M3Y41_10310 [Pseudomonadota bacterium]|nr:hypothetical protein [Pseudomonadota bacterium]
MAASPLSWLAQLWELGRRFDRLLEASRKQADSIRELEDRIEGLERQVIMLRADRERLVTEARSAATAASSVVIGQLAMELGMLKERIVEHPRRLGRSPE